MQSRTGRLSSACQRTDSDSARACLGGNVGVEFRNEFHVAAVEVQVACYPLTIHPGITHTHTHTCRAKNGSPYSITERRVPELIPVPGSQPAGDVSHKPGGRLPLLSARPAVTPATLKRAAINFAVW